MATTFGCPKHRLTHSLRVVKTSGVRICPAPGCRWTSKSKSRRRRLRFCACFSRAEAKSKRVRDLAKVVLKLVPAQNVEKLEDLEAVATKLARLVLRG